MANDIGWAVNELRAGQKVCRVGWNGVGMWLELQVPGLGSKMNAPYVYINMRRPGGTYILIPWNCSQADLLAYDWELAD